MIPFVLLLLTTPLSTQASAMTIIDATGVAKAATESAPKHRHQKWKAAHMMKSIVKELDLTKEEVQEFYAKGSTLKEVITAKGRQPDEVKQAILSNKEERMNAKVKEDWMTEKKKEAILEHCSSWFDEHLNQPLPNRKQHKEE